MDTAYIKKYYLSTPNFQISNPNPEWKKKKGYRWDRGDCAIRALANAADVSWLEAFDYLIGHARAEYNVPNDKGGFRRYLCEGGGKWTAVKAEKRKKRMTVLDFAKSHPKGRYAVQIASHETAVVNGVILDAWNCGEKAVVGYIDMREFSLENK